MTSAGAEVIETNQNWNYSRSLLFAWAIPYYHFGLRASIPIGVDITCEINPPTKGTDRRCGGVLLKDSGSGLYLAHSGKVGGGRKGVGKTNFLKGYSETHPVVALGARPSVEQIDWPNGGTREVVLLGKIGDRSFVNNLADYIRAVGEFKANATGQTAAAISEKNPDLTFVPEFEGPRKKYKLTN